MIWMSRAYAESRSVASISLQGPARVSVRYLALPRAFYPPSLAASLAALPRLSRLELGNVHVEGGMGGFVECVRASRPQWRELDLLFPPCLTPGHRLDLLTCLPLRRLTFRLWDSTTASCRDGLLARVRDGS